MLLLFNYFDKKEKKNLKIFILNLVCSFIAFILVYTIGKHTGFTNASEYGQFLQLQSDFAINETIPYYEFFQSTDDMFKVLKNGKASIMRTRLIKIPLQLFKPKKIHCMLIRKIKNIAVKHKGLLQLLICNWLVRSRSDDVHLQLMLEVGVGD